MTLNARWIDDYREPKCAPDPAYPFGVDIDISGSQSAACATALQYPAPRCGFHLVECSDCGQRVVITTAGRPDDPRSVKIACLHMEKIN